MFALKPFKFTYMKNGFPLYEDLKIHGMLFTSHNIPYITLLNEQCLKLLLGVCNTKKEGRSFYISVSVAGKAREI
jgi:hypothetical protein